LIENNAKVDAHGRYGYTPLHIACHEALDIAKLLIEKGANLYTKNKSGETPFDILDQREEFGLLAFAVRDELTKEDKNGQTPLMIAINEDHDDYAFALLSQGADLFHESSTGDSAFKILQRTSDLPKKLKSIKEKLLLQDLLTTQEESDSPGL